MALTTINSEGIEDGSLKNIDVKSDAAIAGTKIAPDFGSQNIVTTGNINIGTGTGRLDSSGIIKTAHGTEAAPSHTFINDPDNGMFRSATNQIAFSTGGSTALTIDSSGKVGIGETDPDELLHIASTGTVKFRLTDNRTSIADNSQYGVIQFEQRDSNTPGVSLEIAALMTDTSNGATALQIKTGTPATITERLRIDSNGRVMIGTTTKGHSNADDLTVNNSGNCGITIRSGSSSDGNIFFADAESDTVGALKYDHDDNAFQINVDGDERLYITSAGKVGINEATPLAYLHVKEGDSGVTNPDNSQDTVFIENSANAGITIATPNTSTGYLTFADPQDSNIGQIVYRHGGDNANSMGFFVNAQERVRIESGGDVSITDGNLVVANTHGIDFSASESSNTTASSVLADYEEGTWVPTPNANLTLDTAYDTFGYVKVGKMVTIRGYFVASAVSASTPITLSLPFTVEQTGWTDRANYGGSGAMFKNISGDYGTVAAYTPEGSSTMNFYRCQGDDTGWSRLANSHITTSSGIYFTHTYFAA